MRDLQGKKRLRDLLHSPVLSVLLFIMVISLFRSNYDIYKKNRIVKINRQESDRKLFSLREKSDNLRVMLDSLETEKGIEEELRNKFQIMKNGEEVLVVVDEEVSREDVGAINEDSGYWQKFKSFFEL